MELASRRKGASPALTSVTQDSFLLKIRLAFSIHRGKPCLIILVAYEQTHLYQVYSKCVLVLKHVQSTSGSLFQKKSKHGLLRRFSMTTIYIYNQGKQTRWIIIFPMFTWLLMDTHTHTHHFWTNPHNLNSWDFGVDFRCEPLVATRQGFSDASSFRAPK